MEVTGESSTPANYGYGHGRGRGSSSRGRGRNYGPRQQGDEQQDMGQPRRGGGDNNNRGGPGGPMTRGGGTSGASQQQQQHSRSFYRKPPGSGSSNPPPAPANTNAPVPSSSPSSAPPAPPNSNNPGPWRSSSTNAWNSKAAMRTNSPSSNNKETGPLAPGNKETDPEILSAPDPSALGSASVNSTEVNAKTIKNNAPNPNPSGRNTSPFGPATTVSGEKSAAEVTQRKDNKGNIVQQSQSPPIRTGANSGESGKVPPFPGSADGPGGYGIGPGVKTVPFSSATTVKPKPQSNNRTHEVTNTGNSDEIKSASTPSVWSGRPWRAVVGDGKAVSQAEVEKSPPPHVPIVSASSDKATTELGTSPVQPSANNKKTPDDSPKKLLDISIPKPGTKQEPDGHSKQQGGGGDNTHIEQKNPRIPSVTSIEPPAGPDQPQYPQPPNVSNVTPRSRSASSSGEAAKMKTEVKIVEVDPKESVIPSNPPPLINFNRSSKTDISKYVELGGEFVEIVNELNLITRGRICCVDQFTGCISLACRNGPGAPLDICLFYPRAIQSLRVLGSNVTESKWVTPSDLENIFERLNKKSTKSVEDVYAAFERLSRSAKRYDENTGASSTSALDQQRASTNYHHQEPNDFRRRQYPQRYPPRDRNFKDKRPSDYHPSYPRNKGQQQQHQHYQSVDSNNVFRGEQETSGRRDYNNCNSESSRSHHPIRKRC